MTKQEFMAMSLPYGLKFKATKRENIKHLCGFNFTDEEPHIYAITKEQSGIFGNEQILIMNCNPILHPISDLTKEIEHNGGKFVPIVELAKMFSPYKEKAVDYEVVTMFTEPTAKLLFDEKIKCRYMYYSLPCPYNIEKYTFGVIQKLIEWNFDIANLIEKGEAIDVNSLNENPYK